MATDPTGFISIPPDLIRGVSWKPPARMATTANVTLSGLQTIDGIAGAAADVVLVKDQTAGSGNGLYLMKSGAWVRHFSMDQDLTTAVPANEVLGAAVYVIAGTVNGGTFWRVTNTAAPVLGTTAIVWAQWAVPATALTIKDEGSSLATAATSIDFVGAGVVASGAGAAKTVTIAGGATALDDLTDVVITSPALDQSLIHSGSGWINTSAIWRPLMDGAGAVITDAGTGEAVMALS